MDYQPLSSKNKNSDGDGYSVEEKTSGKICPSCQGTGRISKDDEENLVALIPYDDERLKPSRTKYYVIFAVAICLVAFGLALFFFWPRSVVFSRCEVLSQNVTIYEDTQTTNISMLMQFNVTNTNYFKMYLKDIEVDISFHGAQVGNVLLNLTSQSVPPLTTKSFQMVGDALFDANNDQDDSGKTVRCR